MNPYSLSLQVRYPEADLLFQRSLAIREKIQGPWHLDTSNTLNYRAVLWMEQVMMSTQGKLSQRVAAVVSIGRPGVG